MLSNLMRYIKLRRIMISSMVVGIVIILGISIWRHEGGNLPSLDGLRAGMTKAQVEAIVGPPTSKGERPDGTSWRVIVRPESTVWIELDFNTTGHLSSFHYERF